MLWDLDGTLIDSRDQHWRAWRNTMEAQGAPITEAEFEATFGQRNEAFLGAWLGGDTDPAAVRRVGDAKESRYRALLEREGVQALPGALDWVEYLHGGGWRQAIATSAPRRNAELVTTLLGIGDRIAAVVAAGDVDEGKPAPDVFLEAADRLRVTPSRCVVVEDAAAGVEAAGRAGMRCVGIGVPRADVTVGSLTELPGDTFERLIGTADDDGA